MSRERPDPPEELQLGGPEAVEMVLPDRDKYSQTRSEMLDNLAYMLGGMAAEALIFHDVTSGAGNDIEKATGLARAMVTQYGMTERLGAIKLGESNSEPFLGRDFGHQRNYSEDVAAIVDEETKKFLATAHQEAFDILEENRDVLDALVLELLDKETLDKAEVAEVFEPLRRRAARPELADARADGHRVSHAHARRCAHCEDEDALRSVWIRIHGRIRLLKEEAVAAETSDNPARGDRGRHKRRTVAAALDRVNSC